MLDAAGERFAGLPVAEAQEAVVAALSEEGALEAHEPYTHSVPFSHRSGERIEPLISLQWFCRMDELAGPAIEAVEQLALDREPTPQLFRSTVGVLRTIAERPSSMNVPAFYWKLLAAEGLSPMLDACVRCEESGDGVEIVAFDLDEGGVLCRNCRSGGSLSPAALSLLRAVLGGRLNEALAAPESPATHEVGLLATRAMEHHLERRLKTIALFERH